MPISLVVCGAAGRMGRAIIEQIVQNPEARLSAAVEGSGHPALGRDAGELAGTGPLGVPITEELAAVLNPEVIVLDFTSASASVDHLRRAVAAGAGIVIGSTGFTAEQERTIEDLAPATRSVIAPNMSVGVTVLLELVDLAARTLGDSCDIEIVEMHHNRKKDAPSGTALALARAAAKATERDPSRDLVYGREGMTGERNPREIGVHAVRGGDVIGDHTVILAGLSERLELTHRAQSRTCLAGGALRAALWVADQPKGRYGMRDVLGLAR